MSAIKFRTMLKGKLPDLSYIFRKLEPLGTEFKTVACYVIGSLIFLEIQQCKDGMKSSRYHLELGATAASTKRSMEETKGLGQRDLKGSMRDCFLFDSWFFSKKSDKEAASTGVDLIGLVKTNTKQFCKARIEVLKKELACHILHSVEEQAYGTRGKAATCYWLQVQLPEVPIIFSTSLAKSTTLGIPYLSKYPNQFYDVSIRPVACSSSHV